MKQSPAQVASRYADVKQLLDQALRAGGGTYNAPSHGNAVHLRQRCYSFRKAYREASAPNGSPYDALSIRKLAPGQTAMLIEPVRLAGTFTPNEEGKPIAAPEVDELELEAQELRSKLGFNLEL